MKFEHQMLLILSVWLGAAAVAPAEGLPRAFPEGELTGWTATQHQGSWQIEGEILTAKNDPQKQGSVLWSEQSYGDFIMQFDFKLGAGTVDSGVFVRHIKDQIQIGESGSLKRDMTGSPYIEGAGYPVEAEGVADLLSAEDWNRMTIVAIGPRYDVWLNGRHVMQYASESALEEGPIGLQVHANRDMSIQYRDVRLAELR